MSRAWLRTLVFVLFGLGPMVAAADGLRAGWIENVADYAARIAGTRHDFTPRGSASRDEALCVFCHLDQDLTRAVGSSTCLGCHDGGMGPDVALIRTGWPMPAGLRPPTADRGGDHPIGIIYPRGGTRDYRRPNGQLGDVVYFDRNGNGRLDADEIRLYRSAAGDSVECGSCHDPHGVRTNDSSGRAYRAFLRTEGSARLCGACHDL